MVTNFIKTKGRDGIIMYNIDSIEEQYEILEPGVYKLKDYGNMLEGEKPAFLPLHIPDNLIQFKTGIFSETTALLNRFFSDKTISIYKELKIGHKVGTILYGRPGTGKTCLAQIIMQELVKNNKAICLDATEYSIKFIERTIHKIRKYQQNPIIIFIDEIEQAMLNEEYSYLTFLDGSDSIVNTAIIGCTNYIDKIPDRIKNRRSRIKHLFEIKSLPTDVYKEYLTSKIGTTHSNQVAKFVHYAVEAELTLDELKHAITDFVIDEVPIEKACENVKVKH